MSETVGARIRRLRLAKGLSQRAVSGPGCCYAFVSRVEAGERQPSMKALRVLAPKLGVTVEYLETGARVAVVEGVLDSTGSLLADLSRSMREAEFEKGDPVRITLLERTGV